MHADVAVKKTRGNMICLPKTIQYLMNFTSMCLEFNKNKEDPMCVLVMDTVSLKVIVCKSGYTGSQCENAININGSCKTNK
jgi:hypothetical protein